MLRSEPTHPSMCKLAARALVLLAVLSGSFLVGNAIAVNFNLTVAKGGSGSGLVAADVGAVNCGGICSGVYPSGTLITLTATPAGSSQFTGWLGPCTGLGACQFTINSPTTVSATFASPAIGARPLDIDGTNSLDALTDGLLVIRYLFGLSGASLINGAVGPGASRTTAAQIASYLADVRPVLDVDGNGQADALTDGLLAIRYLFGLRGTALIADAVGTGATRTTAASIEAYLPLGFQSIAFSSTAPADATVGLAPYTVAATASSGLSVTFTIDAMASGVCSVSGSTVSFTAAGTCVIDADQPGNANYGAAPRMQQSFAVSARSLTVTSLPFADSFTAAPGNALSSNWVEQAGHFSTATSTAVGQAAANVATLYGLSAGNVALQADVSLTSDGQWAGLVARYSGPLDNNEYYARLTRLAAGSFQAAIYRVQGGVATQLSVQSTAIGTATLRFEVAGPSLKLFLNNSLVAYAQDTTFTTGSVGIRTSTNATLDNFSASQISFASIVLPFADNFDVATNQQLGSSWVEQAGNYAVAGGIATGQAAVNLAVLNGLSTVDGTVSAYFGLSVINSFAGLVARYTGPGGGNTYVANVALLADGYYHASILKSTAGGALTQVGSSVTLATFSLLSFKLLGSTLTLATDGTNQVSVSDSSITTAGTLGMRVSNGVAVNDFIAN